jgi:hypothetical protein
MAQEVHNRLARTGKMEILVSRESAIGGFINEKHVHAPANHSTIAKIDKHQGSIYPRLRYEIKAILAPMAQVQIVQDEGIRQESTVCSTIWWGIPFRFRALILPIVFVRTSMTPPKMKAGHAETGAILSLAALPSTVTSEMMHRSR